MTTYPPIQDRTRHLRKLHALGKERGLNHEALRSFVGVASLGDASIAQLQSACAQLDAMPRSQGGQYSSPLPREPRSAWRPSSLPQAPKPNPPTLGWCYMCHLPSQTPLCASCKKKEVHRAARARWNGAVATHPDVKLDFGPIAAPNRPLTVRNIDLPLLCDILRDSASSYDPHYRALRYEWSGELNQATRGAIETWMQKHGAVQPSPAILPNYWLIEGRHLTLSINTTGSGRTHITLLDLSDHSSNSNNRIAQPQHSELYEVTA